MAIHKFRVLRLHDKAVSPNLLFDQEEYSSLPGCPQCIVCTFIDDGHCPVCNHQFH